MTLREVARWKLRHIQAVGYFPDEIRMSWLAFKTLLIDLHGHPGIETRHYPIGPPSILGMTIIIEEGNT